MLVIQMQLYALYELDLMVSTLTFLIIGSVNSVRSMLSLFSPTDILVHHVYFLV